MNGSDGWLRGWPGLPALWRRGRFDALAVALLFGGLLNTALLAQFVWPQWLAPPLVVGLWAAVALGVLGGWWTSHGGVSSGGPLEETPAEGADDLFLQAQTEYLRGHWDEAEWLLDERLASVPRDVEARLLLATLHRHRRRPRESREQLAILKGFDESVRWSEEIERESALLEQWEGLAEDSAASPSEVEPAREAESAARPEPPAAELRRRAA